jgi:hypothetical protein
MAVVTVAALALAGLESAKLLLGIIKHELDEKEVRQIEADFEIYILQKTLPDDHTDINDSLFIRVRNRLLQHVEKINSIAKANGKNG